MRHILSTKSKHTITQEKGFTLVELMVTLAISGVVMTAIYSTYIMQQRSYVNQEAVAEMQQNIRAAKILPSIDIRMAGYSAEINTDHYSSNPGAAGPALPGILATTANQLDLSFDIRGLLPGSPPNGDCNDPGENVSYYLNTDVNGTSNLVRLDNNSPSNLPIAIAENIEHIEFRYLDGTGTAMLPSDDPADVRAIQISILARTGRSDRKFTNSTVYCPASNPYNLATGLCKSPAPAAIWTAPNDNFRRRLLITTIQCRNMGL